EQRKMAEYIASGVSTVASRAGVDGGMNPVFIAKLSTPGGLDNNGRYQVASTTTAPGALPRVSEAPGALPRTTTVTPPAASAEAPVRQEPAVAAGREPVMVASVPMPRAAPQPKQGEAPADKPTTIAGLIDGWFGGSKAEAASSTHEKEQVAVRSSNTDLAAKPKQAAPVAPVRTASAGASVPVHSTAAAPTPAPVTPAPKARETAPKTTAAPAPPPAWPAPPQPAKADKPEPPRVQPQQQQPEIRTAYSTPPASNNGLLTGAQPVVPVGSFNSFR
ncbi:MAG: hypothetical protein WCF37_05740, partial [Pseudolabrys sp.]